MPEGVFRKFQIENLEPGDIVLLLAPGLVREHVARYVFVSKALGDGADKKNLAIVDAASARGYGADILRKDFPAANVVGIEVSENYVNRAKNKYNAAGRGKPINFVQGDVRKLPLDEDSADIVTAFEITEHLPQVDQIKFIKGVERVLKPGGFFIISIPERYSFKKSSSGEIVRSGRSSNPHHLYEPTREEALKMLAEAGFGQIAEYGQFFVNKDQLGLIKKVSEKIAVYSTYAWTWPRNAEVKPYPKNNQVPLTHIFVAKK